jgi:hypothetical protein
MAREMNALLDRPEMQLNLVRSGAKAGGAFYIRAINRHSLPPEGVAYLTRKIEQGGWTRVTLESSPFNWGAPAADDLFYCREGILLSLTSTAGSDGEDWQSIVFQYDQRTMGHLCKGANAK